MNPTNRDAAVPRPCDLFERLNAGLTAQAERLVDAKLQPALSRAIDSIALEMGELVPGIRPAVSQFINVEAGRAIREVAVRRTFNVLLEQVVTDLELERRVPSLSLVSSIDQAA